MFLPPTSGSQTLFSITSMRRDDESGDVVDIDDKFMGSFAAFSIRHKRCNLNAKLEIKPIDYYHNYVHSLHCPKVFLK